MSTSKLTSSFFWKFLNVVSCHVKRVSATENDFFESFAIVRLIPFTVILPFKAIYFFSFLEMRYQFHSPRS